MTLEGKTVFMTGANGFLGSRIAKRLVAMGAKVRALVRKKGAAPELLSDQIEELQGEFTDPAAVAEAAKGTQFVIHCAATVGKDLEDARLVNATGTKIVLDEARKAGCERIVHISTVAVYDTGDRDVIDEESPQVKAGHQYGLTKAEAEVYAWSAIREGLNVVILRPCAILGIHPTSSWGMKVPGRVKEGKMPLKIDGGDTYAYVHVENLVDSVLLSLESEKAPGNAYNVVDGHTTWRRFIDDIRSWFDAPEPPIVPKEEVPDGDYWMGSFSTKKIEKDLGYQPRLSYEDGMGEAERYWRANG